MAEKKNITKTKTKTNKTKQKKKKNTQTNKNKTQHLLFFLLLLLLLLLLSPFFPRGPLECQEGYQARPKIHVIRVVFQDQARTHVYHLGVQKSAKLEEKKRVCFWCVIDKFWKGHDGQIKKNACKNAYLGSFFIPEKYVIRVLFVCPWTSLKPPLAIRVAPGFFFSQS